MKTLKIRHKDFSFFFPREGSTCNSYDYRDV